MKRIRPGVIRLLSTAALLLSLAAIAFAQTPKASPGPAASQPTSQGERLSVTIVSVKPGMVGEFQSFVKNDTNPALIKGGAKWSDVWATMIGDVFEFIIVSPVDNFAQLDSPGPLEKGLGKEGLMAWRVKADRLVNGVRSSVMVFRPELSYEPKMTGPPQLAVATFTYVAPGRNAEYENFVKNDALPVIKQSQIAGYWVQQTIFGGDPNEYIILTLQNNFAELDKGPPAIRVLGEEGAAKLMQKLPAGVVTRAERKIIRYIPELSYRPQPTTANK